MILESTDMPIDNNFVAVLPTVLVDPVLKLRLEHGRWTPESQARGGSMDLHLSYDPEIRADRLTMPIPPKHRELLEILGPIRRDWTVFESEKSRRITEIFVDIHDREDVRLEFIPSGRSIRVQSELLARQGVDDLSERPYEVLLYMFQSTVLMPEWAETNAVLWGKRSISFYTTSEIADELFVHTGARFEHRKDGLAKIAARQLRP